LPEISARVWCLTPNPVLETKFSRGRTVVSAGGKGHNVARQLRQWEVPAFSVTAQTGADWLRAARKDRVLVRQIPIHSTARTGWALLEKAGERLDFFTQDPVWKKHVWIRCGTFLSRNIRKGDWLVVAGSTPRGAPSGWWRFLFLGLKKKGAQILVDGKGGILREALQAGVNWAKANLGEAEETTGQRGPERCLRSMETLSRGKCGLLITLGSRGLVLRTGKRKLAVAAPNIQCRDATGSGDVVTSAWVYGILRGWEIEKVAGFAVWAGSEKAAQREMVVKRLKGRGVPA
jgi:fructose-1-phosphate kinase PfkB-like protein